MGARTFRPIVVGTGLSVGEHTDDPLTALVTEILGLTAEDAGYAVGLLGQLIALVERHAWRVEQVLQRFDSSALGAARRSHESLLLHLEQIHDGVLDPASLMVQLRLACGHLMDLIIMDARALHQCAGHMAGDIVLH